MTETHQIIVLGSTRYGDDRLLVRALARAAGRVTLSLPLVRSPRSPLRAALFHPLAILEAVWEASPTATVFRPRKVRVLERQDSMMLRPDKMAISMFLAEFLSYATLEGEFGEEFFDYVAYAIEWLEACPADYANFHIVFLFRLTRFLGIQPDWEAVHGEGRYFDLMNAGFCDSVPGHGAYLEGADAHAARQLARMNFATMRLFGLSGQQRTVILRRLLDFYRLHLTGFPRLKSLDVLETVFG